ncbi:MAG: sensor histidine kinase [Demequinaceae bacterium]|nr:sensor histidine kinase [Demequinaceae bacterium]
MSETSVVRWAPLRVRGLDAGIAFALCALAMLYTGPGADIGLSGTHEQDLLGIVLIVAQTLPLIWRQSAPRTVLVIILAAWVVDRGLEYRDTIAMLGLIVAIHSIATFLPTRQAYRWGSAALVITSGWTTLGVLTSDSVQIVHLMIMVLVTVIPFAIGRADALSRERATAIEVAHRGALISQREATESAIRTERARIARELHDVVAHEITVMTLQAEGARRALGSSTPAVTDALRIISDSGRKGLVEMNRMIGVLRDSSESESGEPEVGTSYAPASVSHLDPMPALASLPALAKQVEDAGLPVDLKIIGKAHVPAGVELSAYRIVQESLTNALKHAGPGAGASVVVLRDPEAVTVTVEDDGRGVIADALASGGGHGLAGIRERVLALEGSFEFGPRPGGGFRISAVLPSHDDTILPPSRRTKAVHNASKPAPRKGSRS